MSAADAHSFHAAAIARGMQRNATKKDDERQARPMGMTACV